MFARSTTLAVVDQGNVDWFFGDGGDPATPLGVLISSSKGAFF
jgi:hypothetical protein